MRGGGDVGVHSARGVYDEVAVRNSLRKTHQSYCVSNTAGFVH